MNEYVNRTKFVQEMILKLHIFIKDTLTIGSGCYRVTHLKLYYSRLLFFHHINHLLMSKIHFYILKAMKFYNL